MLYDRLSYTRAPFIGTMTQLMVGKVEVRGPIPWKSTRRSMRAALEAERHSSPTLPKGQISRHLAQCNRVMPIPTLRLLPSQSWTSRQMDG